MMKVKCRYCHRNYQPRPQVKNPKACNQSKCQAKRQRDNEKAWHYQQFGRFDTNYHKKQRQQRRRLMESLIRRLHNVLAVGMAFHGQRFESDLWKVYLQEWFFHLGIRRINKLCFVEKII